MIIKIISIMNTVPETTILYENGMPLSAEYAEVHEKKSTRTPKIAD